MTSQTPVSPVLSSRPSSDPFSEPGEPPQSPVPARGLFPINEQENQCPSNPFADPPIRSTGPLVGSLYNTSSPTGGSPPPLITCSPNPKHRHSSTLETAEAQPCPSSALFKMPYPVSWKWPQGAAHPLKVVHYTLIFQAAVGILIFVLIIQALRNLGWWTQRGTAAGLAREFHSPLEQNTSRMHQDSIPALHALPQPRNVVFFIADASCKTVTASGVTAFVVLPIQLVVGYMSPADTACLRRIRTTVGALLCLSLMGLHGAAGAVMVKSPGKDFRKSFDKPPYAAWWTAAILVFAQLYVCPCGMPC